jgi:uncharacterized protein
MKWIRTLQALLFPLRGFRFACTRCGHCCCIPGAVFFTPDEAQAAADALHINLEDFKKLYIRSECFGMLECYTRTSCPLYSSETGCTIYPVRPHQCSSFPFWREHFCSRAELRALYEKCPGMGRGRRWSRKKTMEILNLKENRIL